MPTVQRACHMTDPHSFTRSRAQPGILFWTLLGLVLLLAWDCSGLDLTLARWAGGAEGFQLQNHWLWSGILHDRIRPLPWLVELTLLVTIWRPFGSFRQLPVERRVQMALSTLLALLLVSSIKLHSKSSCPWDLKEFGGLATYVSHWTWGLADGGGGNCFPAGHASAGFAFLAGFFVFRHVLPARARRWLVGAVAAGLLLGLAQQLRGAHYMSHTLWTAWFCWTSAALVDAAVSQLMLQKPPPAQAQVPALATLQPWMPPR